MFCPPRVRASRGIIFVPFIVLAVTLCLFIFAPTLHAQQISGLQAPVKAKSLEQEAPAQVRAARGQAPLSRLYDFIKVEASRVRRLSALPPQERREEGESKKLRIGTVRAFARPVKVSTDAALYSVAEGDVRVMGIVSEGAQYTRVHFNAMALPAGARVFVYSAQNPDDFYGPYEGDGPSDDGAFWTPPVEGDSVVIEYFTPRGAALSSDTPFQISEVSHIYRSLFTGTDDVAGSCNLDVSSNWSEVAKSVGYLEFTSGGNEYACTGTLLNNQSNDQTPYLLTANHCFDQQVEAQTLRVYWFYNSGDVPPPGTPHTDGANLLSTSTTSDFSLVRLTGTMPGGLYFSGWDATPVPLSTAVTGIHHPEASHKRISFGNTISGCGAGLPGPCQNFTNIHWTNGTTEEGSSGSGIWTGSPSDPKLVGTLTGGFASCSNLSGTDYYGSFSATYPFISSFLQHGDNGPDDNLEDNDTRATAHALDSGTYNNLVVSSVDQDWYKVSIPPRGIVSARLTFQSSNGNINMQLFQGNDAADVGTANGTASPKVLVAINQTGATIDYYIRIYTSPTIQNSYTLTVAGTGAVCAASPISYGQPVNGTLSTSDCQSAVRSAGASGNFYSDHYTFAAVQGQQISVTLTPVTPFNTFLSMQGVNGGGLYSDSQTTGKQGSSANFLAPATGTYTIEVSSFDPGVTGNYTLTLNQPPDVITFSKNEYDVREEDGRVVLTINRGPSAAGEASVDYATSDFSGLIECSRVTGSASPRCDYANSVGTLRFAPGETAKTLSIPIVDDSFAEGFETFEINLTNPVGVTLGAIPKGVVLIRDNETVAGANPISQATFFIRQQYIDFLGREPDPNGFLAWQGILNGCPPSGKDAQGNFCDRIEVSSGFFRSPEFKDRGYFVYRFYSTALGRIPRYSEFMPDLGRVSGFLSDAQLESNKVAFVQEFMARTEFQNKYGALTSASDYVNALVSTAGVTLANKQTLIDDLQAGRKSRAETLRAVAESTEVFNKYFNEAFVVMQYFGYLRRDPDALYTQWIQTMNTNGGDYRTMIQGFINANEYVLRFGP